MTSLADVLAALEPSDDGAGWRGAIPDGWLQGRTSYGGLSSAMALHCAMRADVDLPPLRSAQVSFVGPLAGEVQVTTQRLRRGRNAAFVQADVSSAAGLGLRCTFVFMRAVDSTVDHDRTPAPDSPPPAPGEPTLRGHPAVAFTHRFEMLDRADALAEGGAEWLRWVRLAERGGLDPMVELVAVADCLPPAALRLLGRAAPTSSVTWMLNVLDPAPATEDGWWLLSSQTDHARGGGSSQAMGMWNAAGRMVAQQMQSVAIFG